MRRRLVVHPNNFMSVTVRSRRTGAPATFVLDTLAHDRRRWLEFSYTARQDGTITLTQRCRVLRAGKVRCDYTYAEPEELQVLVGREYEADDRIVLSRGQLIVEAI